MLEVKKINKSFGDAHILKDVSFSVERGKAYGLLGRNGSGKTTTIRIIMDIFEPDSGEVIIDGVKNTKSKLNIGYMPEERGLYPKRSIADQMTYFGELRGLTSHMAKQRSKELLIKLGAEEYLPRQLDTLSKGNQQKIQLAIALINDPDIIILDEPFSGLDPINAKLLKDLVLEMISKNKMVLFSSHQMASVEEFCDDVCIINRGEIVLEGNLDQIKHGYPRNRILIEPLESEHKNMDDFLKQIKENTNLIDQIELKRNGFEVQLKSEQDKTPLLQKIIKSDLEIDNFSVLEPSLEEIFVEKAGENKDEQDA